MLQPRAPWQEGTLPQWERTSGCLGSLAIRPTFKELRLLHTSKQHGATPGACKSTYLNLVLK